jgi:thiamine pyrophosphate-dependent acetolactate synthase large subunit-like protein
MVDGRQLSREQKAQIQTALVRCGLRQQAEQQVEQQVESQKQQEESRAESQEQQSELEAESQEQQAESQEQEAEIQAEFEVEQVLLDDVVCAMRSYANQQLQRENQGTFLNTFTGKALRQNQQAEKEDSYTFNRYNPYFPLGTNLYQRQNPP